jgi:hypothetical protein
MMELIDTRCGRCRPAKEDKGGTVDSAGYILYCINYLICMYAPGFECQASDIEHGTPKLCSHKSGTSFSYQIYSNKKIHNYCSLVFSLILYLLLINCIDIVLKFNSGGSGCAMFYVSRLCQLLSR